ncbi:phosphorylase [Leptospira perolatii]|uniref:Phosphorylase n=1 Tax=Leptospira perolatii TaxID=2023191 RepID=A0A2M9ZK03_9LEPT|nr:phosphorylase [Leptospira perolatii]PJZ69448.1 phosphorylase [Leptospira perolatii]PJZ72273.1 phosphorylase [Leptospira perolatii]
MSSFQDNDQILFCGAFSGEIDKILQQKEFIVLETGVGLLPSALRLQSYLLEQSPEKLPKSVLFIGSAGVYPWLPRKDWEGKFGLSHSFVNYEIAYLDKKVRIPDFLTLKTEFPPPALPSFSIELYKTGTNGTGSVTLEDLSPRAADRLKGEGIGFESMEAYGIAKVCESFKIPMASLFSLTNRVGPKGSEEWKNSWRKLSDKLQEAIISAYVKS